MATAAIPARNLLPGTLFTVSRQHPLFPSPPHLLLQRGLQVIVPTRRKRRLKVFFWIDCPSLWGSRWFPFDSDFGNRLEISNPSRGACHRLSVFVGVTSSPSLPPSIYYFLSATPQVSYPFIDFFCFPPRFALLSHRS